MTQPEPSKPESNTIATVACVFELMPSVGGTVPTEAHLLPAGFFRSTDGRPESCAAWWINEQTAPQIIARMAARANDTLIDYEHQSLNAEDNGQPVIAAGWFKSMAYRDNGLFATDVQWTSKAAGHIASKEIRYISSVFSYLETTGEVLEIISACITNSPALDGLDALTALNKRLSTQPPPTGTNMADPTVELAALTIERDLLKQSTAALTAERDNLTIQVTALNADKAALTTKITEMEAAAVAKALEDEETQKAELLSAALTSGKVLPAHKPYLSKKTLPDLKEYLEHVAGVPLALLNTQHTHNAPTGVAALTQLERDTCDKTGVSYEDYLQAKG